VKKFSILIIDDEINNRRLLRTVLEHSYMVETVEIYEASDNDEAWHILRRHKIDFITTDIIRPGESGLEFVSQLRR